MKVLQYSLIALIVGVAIGTGSTAIEYAVQNNRFEQEDVVATTVPVNNPTETGQAKVVVVNGEVHDYGEQDESVTAVHQFIFKNIGDAPLVVEEKSTSCKCTIPKLPDGHILPGQTAAITLEWKPKLQGTSFRHTAEISTSDPNRPIVALVVQGTISRTIEFEPSNLVVFNGITASESASRTVTVYARKHEMKMEGFKLIREETKKYFDVSFEELTPEELERENVPTKSGARVTITAEPGLPDGSIEQQVELKTNLELSQPMTIMIQGQVIGDIRFRGQPNMRIPAEMLDLGLLKQGKEHKTTVYVVVRGKHRNDVELSIEPEDISPAGLFVASVGEPKTSANGKTRTFPISITVPADQRPIRLYGPTAENLARIYIRTTHPDRKRVRLFVRLIIEG